MTIKAETNFLNINLNKIFQGSIKMRTMILKNKFKFYNKVIWILIKLSSLTFIFLLKIAGMFWNYCNFEFHAYKKPFRNLETINSDSLIICSGLHEFQIRTRIAQFHLK